MESLEGILEFVEVAKTNGFSSAARNLGVSTGHVSRQIARLEKRLGVSLFIRTTRKVSLSSSGLIYQSYCKDLISLLSNANDEVTGQQLSVSGNVNISVSGLFAERHVTPVLLAFAKLHPDLSINLDFSSRKVNFIDDGIDFSVRYGLLEDS